MARYYAAYEPQFDFYPNYSLQIGDLTGDGRQEIAALSTNGNRLQVLDLEGNLILERRLKNYGTWGTTLPVFIDVNHDGRQEIVVPDGPPGNAFVIAINAENETVRERRIDSQNGDDYGIAIPLLGTFRCDLDGHLGISVGIAGGRMLALDTHFRELWHHDGLRHDFGHELYNVDVNDDGVDEIVFCTVDHINSSDPSVQGDLVILRGTDGSPFLVQAVRPLVNDSHFDDIIIADIRGTGEKEILVEKGLLLDLQGNVIWDISDELEHGQWITTAPNPDGPGLVAFISELWSQAGRSKMVSPTGQIMWELMSDRPTRLNPERYTGCAVLPTRAHTIDWFGDGNLEILLGEQIAGPSGHACYERMTATLKLFCFDLHGRLLAEIPFENTCREGFWYNGEVRSQVTDMDNDGLPEWVFPRQDGTIMIIKKEREG